MDASAATTTSSERGDAAPKSLDHHHVNGRRRNLSRHCSSTSGTHSSAPTAAAALTRWAINVRWEENSAPSRPSLRRRCSRRYALGGASRPPALSLAPFLFSPSRIPAPQHDVSSGELVSRSYRCARLAPRFSFSRAHARARTPGNYNVTWHLGVEKRNKTERERDSPPLLEAGSRFPLMSSPASLLKRGTAGGLWFPPE